MSDEIADWLNLHIEQAEQKIISEIVEDIKENRTKIIEKMVKISETIGLKTEAYYLINDVLEELQEKWEERSK